jgi:hypothetical protein
MNSPAGLLIGSVLAGSSAFFEGVPGELGKRFVHWRAKQPTKPLARSRAEVRSANVKVLSKNQLISHG